MAGSVFMWETTAGLYYESETAYEGVLESRVVLLEALLDMGLDINQPFDGCGTTLLAHAVMGGLPSVVAFLLERGADIKHPPNDACPFCYAVNDSDPECLRLLLEHGARKCDKNASSHRACAEENWRMVDTIYYQWSPARHYRAPPEMRAVVRTALALRTIVPGLADLPREVMHMVFELLPYCK